MKKRMIKALALLLALVMLLGVAAACGASPKAVLTLGEHSLSVNVFQLMLSIQKGNMAYAIASSYGDYNSEAFWGTVIDASSTTFNDYYTYAIYQKAERYLCALALFDELSLVLPESRVEAIDKEMASFVKNDGEGSKKKLNALLAQYGANYDILRESKIMEAKVRYLAENLYGTEGSKIGAAVKDEYYQNHYVAFKQILLSNFYYVYVTDENGDDVYYLDNGSIAYDTEKGTATLVGDKLVYYAADGSIAYDKVNGKRSPVLDANGNATTKKYTTDQMLDRLNFALSLRDVAEGASAEEFERLREAYSDEEFGASFDPSALNYLATNVEYQSISSAYGVFDKLSAKLSELAVGDIAIVQTDAGIHLVRRYPLEMGAYSNSTYSQWFSDSYYSVYDFMGNLIDHLLTTRLAEYEDKVEVDLALLGSVSMKDAVPNYDFR